MNRGTATASATTRGVLVLALAVGLVVVADPHPAVARATEAPTEAPEQGPDLDAACEVSRHRTNQAVTCTVQGLAPEGAAAMTVAPVEDATSPQPFIGGTAVAEDGTAALEVTVPCDVSGPAEVEVTGPTADGGRFRHVEPVTLDGRCRAAWELTADEWATVLATVLVAAAAILVGGLLRRRRRHRRRRSIRGGPPGRRSTTRGAGRRRSPRRRKRRLRR